MQEKFLKEVVREIVGAEAEKIVDLLNGKKNINEFLIAKKLNLTINQTRNILYKLGDVGLVSFIRKKDSKKGGWYTYFWTLNTGKAIDLLKSKILKNLEDLEREFERRKKDRFYYSPDVDIEYTEEQALENNFIDPESGSVLELKDHTEMLKESEKEIFALKEVLTKVEKELSEIEEKEEKSKHRRLKAEEKKKKEEREKRRKKLARERAKLGKGKKKNKKTKLKKSFKKKKKVKKSRKKTKKRK